MSEFPQSQVWDAALSLRRSALQWVKDAKVELSGDPSKRIGQLNEQIAQVNDIMTKVRNVIFETRGLMIALRREMHSADDVYEEALGQELMKVRSEEEEKKLPKSAAERERLFRTGFPDKYKARLETARRLEEWEDFEKMLNAIYFSLRDTNGDINTQLGVIKQQYFSGELKMAKGAVDLASFLGDDAAKFLGATGESGLTLNGVEEVTL